MRLRGKWIKKQKLNPKSKPPLLFFVGIYPVSSDKNLLGWVTDLNPKREQSNQGQHLNR